MRTLTISINPDHESVMREAGKMASTAIETGQYQGEGLNFETLDSLFSYLTAHRCEILNSLQLSGKTTLHELARKLGLDANQLQPDIHTLLELGIIEQDNQGALLCPYDHIHLDIPDSQHHS